MNTEEPRLTGINDWHKLVLKHHEYYRSRRRRQIRLLVIGAVIGYILSPIARRR